MHSLVTEEAFMKSTARAIIPCKVLP